MLPDDLKDLSLIPADELQEGFQTLPPDPGIYCLFFRGGGRILERTEYARTDARHPLEVYGRAHLYTGAAQNLRFRLSQHLRNESIDNSSPRKSLWALETLFGAVSESTGHNRRLASMEDLTDWMFENVLIGIERHPHPLAREAEILRDPPSPFNINNRRRHIYSRWLMAWREEVFPPLWSREFPPQLASRSSLIAARPTRGQARRRNVRVPRPSQRREKGVARRMIS